MKNALVVGGANGIGLAIAHQFAEMPEIDHVYIVDVKSIQECFGHAKFIYFHQDLLNTDFSIFRTIPDVKYLMITAGFGRLSLFKDISEDHIVNSFMVNTIAPIRIIQEYYDKLSGPEPFYCGVMVSIAGYLSSPFFSIYGATKAALRSFIESINVELTKAGTDNRILNVSPGSIKGTSFNNGTTDLRLTEGLAKEIVQNLLNRNDLFIPQYEEIFKDVLERYHKDFRAEGLHSYDYKLKSGRM